MVEKWSGRGRPPTPRARVTPAFLEAYVRASCALVNRDLCKMVGVRPSLKWSYETGFRTGGLIVASPRNVERLEKFARAVGYDGPILEAPE